MNEGQQPGFRKVVVVGAGAVGSYFGAVLAQAGHPVTLVGRAAHVQVVRADGLRLHKAGRVEVVRLAATTELEAVQGADLVLFCVKSTDTEAVATAIAPWLDADALVMSLQNGVENAPTIARRVQRPVLPTVVYVATAMPGPGEVSHHGRGDLVVGPADADAAGDPALARRIDDLAAVFAAAGIPVRVSATVVAELWSKLMVNCAYNAVSGLAQATYAQLAAQPEVVALQEAVVAEVVALAAAEGVPMALPEALAAMHAIARTMPGQRSSTAQDMARGRPSEIDHLNGFVARRARVLGVATPVNQTLHALVKLVEAGRMRA
jgi:2-dehydropantoate 2-reductase